MDISRKEEYILLEYSENHDSQLVKIHNTYSQVLKSWNYLNRVSPIFPVKFNGAKTQGSQSIFTKKVTLFFIGPLNPAELDWELIKGGKVWITFGLFNIIIYIKTGTQCDLIEKWLVKNNIRNERWDLNGNKIIKKSYLLLGKSKSDFRNFYKQIKQKESNYVIKSCLNEYFATVSSFLARANEVYPAFIEDILSINEFVKVITDKKFTDSKSIYEVFGFITELNAGISRFSSQTFSGIAPISATESHFWSHSLLGVGIANLAVFRLRKFIQKTVGDLRIPDLFDLNKKITNFDEFKRLNCNEEFWYKNHISENLEDKDLAKHYSTLKKKKIMPLITYFSGREGFRTHHNTLSLPLESINSCNSYEWSLITITHEISHTIIRGILPNLYPDLNNPKELEECMILSDPSSKTKTQFEEIRKYLFHSLVYMEKCAENVSGEYEINSWVEFRDLLDKWHRDVEEIMAHIFDFIYFYEENEKAYISQIWTSWSVIPNIRNRVREYVIRTMCSLSSKYLRKGEETEILARTVFLNTLTELMKKNPENAHYIREAIKVTVDTWDDDIKPNILARKNIIKIVRTFLYSEAFVSKVAQEKYPIRSRSKGKKRPAKIYDLKHYNFTTHPVSNPLVFINQYSNSLKPSIAESLWIYNIMAFNYDDKA